MTRRGPHNVEACRVLLLLFYAILKKKSISILHKLFVDFLFDFEFKTKCNIIYRIMVSYASSFLFKNKS